MNDYLFIELSFSFKLIVLNMPLNGYLLQKSRLNCKFVKKLLANMPEFRSTPTQFAFFGKEQLVNTAKIVGIVKVCCEVFPAG